jgi:hypothetical protein
VIEDEKLDWRIVRKGFPQLLHDPCASGLSQSNHY